MTFGEELGWGSSVETSNAIIDRFLALGGNFIDTASAYTYGHSEEIIGDHVGRTPSRRDRVVIATKFFGNMFAGDPNGGGAGAKSLIASTHESLRRLRFFHDHRRAHLEQLEDNVGALQVELAPAQVAALDEVSKPTLSFPAEFLENAPVFMHGGLTVNGVSAPPWPLAPRPDAPRY